MTIARSFPASLGIALLALGCAGSSDPGPTGNGGAGGTQSSGGSTGADGSTGGSNASGSGGDGSGGAATGGGGSGGNSTLDDASTASGGASQGADASGELDAAPHGCPPPEQVLQQKTCSIENLHCEFCITGEDGGCRHDPAEAVCLEGMWRVPR